MLSDTKDAMGKTKQGDPGGVDLASNETLTSAEPERGTEPLWKKALKLLSASLAVTGIVGSMVGAYFQERGWDHEKTVSKIQDDTTRVLDLEQQVSELIEKRWAAAEEIGLAIQSKVSSEEWERAWDQYNKSFEDGARQLNKLAGQMAFFVDSLFIRETEGKPVSIDDIRKKIVEEIPINCLTYTLEFVKEKNIDPQSATHLLQIINHCHDLAKGDIEQALADGNKHPPAPCNEKQEQDRICDFNRRKSHIWWLNNVLRCTIVERAVTIRNVKTTYLIPHIPSNYHLPEKRMRVIASKITMMTNMSALQRKFSAI